jgi:alkanesulfonate monooxygenase SsuD/methylene tetrahydromethanopterin reductase-like flavin-dependent oxidoreductase (luciferase family)
MATDSRGGSVAASPWYLLPPHVLARTLATLEVLSGGRLSLGGGIVDGSTSYEALGEPGDARIRAQKLDEALDVITRLWSGEPVTHHGHHYVVDGFALTAVPLQRPRIPIWVGGDSRPATWRMSRGSMTQYSANISTSAPSSRASTGESACASR